MKHQILMRVLHLGTSSKPDVLSFHCLVGLLKQLAGFLCHCLNQHEAQRFQSYFSRSKWYYTILPLFLKVLAKNHMKPRGNACSSTAVRFQVSGNSSSCWKPVPPATPVPKFGTNTSIRSLRPLGCESLATEQRDQHFSSPGCSNHTLMEEGGYSSQKLIAWPSPHRKEGGGRGSESKWL